MSATLAKAIWQAEQKYGPAQGVRIAAEIGISPQYYSDIKRAKRLPPPERVRHIAEVLEVQPEHLLWCWVTDHLGQAAADRLAQWLRERS